MQQFKFDVYVLPQTYVNLIKEANLETNAEIKKEKLEKIQQSIDENNVKIASSIETINEEILKSKEITRKTIANFDSVNAEQTGSSLLISDYKTIYELSYVRNITMLLGMFGLASFIYNKWN